MKHELLTAAAGAASSTSIVRWLESLPEWVKIGSTLLVLLSGTAGATAKFVRWRDGQSHQAQAVTANSTFLQDLRDGRILPRLTQAEAGHDSLSREMLRNRLSQDTVNGFLICALGALMNNRDDYGCRTMIRGSRWDAVLESGAPGRRNGRGSGEE